MLAATGAAGILDKGREAFFGQYCHRHQGRVFFTAQLDLFERHPQVGIHPLLGGAQVAAGIELMGFDADFVMALTAQGDDTRSHGQNEQADQQHVQGFMPRAGRAHHLDPAHCSISA
ncbi:hypothetical protein D3C79_917880 [compost metagenome]